MQIARNMQLHTHRNEKIISTSTLLQNKYKCICVNEAKVTFN